MDRRDRSFSTSGQGEFTMQPPKCAQKLKPQRACTCLDKLVEEERERHAKNIAFQKALVKRIEASERRISYGDDDDDDDDDEPRSRSGRGGRKRGAAPAPAPAPAAAPPQPALTSIPPVKPPTVKPVFDTSECKCYKKILQEERKRKKFVRRLEREQRNYEKKNLKAQKQYQKERTKAFRKCEYLQEALDKKFGMNDKSVKITQGDETYSVFLHMDPGECGCTFQDRVCYNFKKHFFKYCVFFYIVAFAICGAVYFLVNLYGEDDDGGDNGRGATVAPSTGGWW